MIEALVFDEEKLDREVLIHISNALGINIVAESDSVKETVKLCNKLCPKLIFINIKKSKPSSINYAKQIRKEHKDIIIFITSLSDEIINDDEVWEICANEFLIKPIKPDTIRKSLKKYISNADNFDEIIEKEKNMKIEEQKGRIKSKEVIKALNYIDENYLVDLNLETVSSHVFLSTFYFSRLFKKELGITFSDYLVRKKIDLAKTLLMSTNKSILEISTYIGFKEQNYFCKVFRKIVGKTPSEFRKSNLISLEN